MIKQGEKILSDEQKKKLLLKLQLKYGIEIHEIRTLVEKDQKCYGFITPDTEAKQQALEAKIKEESGINEF